MTETDTETDIVERLPDAVRVGDVAEKIVADLAKKKPRFIPEGFSETERLVGIRSLLMDGRADEALERLNIVLDRFHGAWRSGTDLNGKGLNHERCGHGGLRGW